MDYQKEVPDNWNGGLVTWAHRFRYVVPSDPGYLELIVGNQPLREFLIHLGYARAASSYRGDDDGLSSGVEDSHALTKRHDGIVGSRTPYTYTGATIGGYITTVAVEQFPNTYDGARPICGVFGDFELIDFFLGFNVSAIAVSSPCLFATLTAGLSLSANSRPAGAIGLRVDNRRTLMIRRQASGHPA